MSAADLLKSLEGSFTFQLIMGIAAAVVVAVKVLEQFKKGLGSEPPPKPGQAVIEMGSITDMQPWRDIAVASKRQAAALESIAASLKIFNKREEAGEADREREALHRLIAEMQRQIASLNQR